MLRNFLLLLVSFNLAYALEALPKARHRNRKPSSVEISTALRTILDAEANRDLKGKTIIALTRHESVTVAKAAIIALGRIGNPAALEPLKDLLNNSNREIRIASAFSLSLIGGEGALLLLGQHTEMHKEPEVTAAVLSALGRAGNQSHVATLNRQLLNAKDPVILAGAAEGMGVLWTGDSAKWPVPDKLLQRLVALAQIQAPPKSTENVIAQYRETAITAAYALARFKGDWTGLSPVELADAAKKASVPEAQAYLYRALGKIKSTVSANSLAQELNGFITPDASRIEAAKGLGNQAYSETIAAALTKALDSKSSAVVVTALDTMGSFENSAAALAPAVVAALTSSQSVWVRASALKNLSRIAPETATEKAKQIWASASEPPEMDAAAAFALARIGGSTELDLLADWLPQADTRIVVEALDGLASNSEEKMTPNLRVVLRQLLEKADAGITSQIAALTETYRWTDFAPALATIYRFFSAPDQVEPKVAILNALASAGDSSHLEVIQLGLKDKEKSVVTAAVKALKAVTGKDESKLIPLNSGYTQSVPSLDQIKSAVSSRVLLKTTRGEIQLKMLSAAPLTAATFVKLVKEDFYSGKLLHRVVPNFVVQGGDPRGDGYGGPGFLIRDEVSLVKHRRGTVGIATAGKDTGGCQFFINLTSNIHLNGKYTVFAEVTRGMDVVDRLEVGDKILSAKLF